MSAPRRTRPDASTRKEMEPFEAASNGSRSEMGPVASVSTGTGASAAPPPPIAAAKRVLRSTGADQLADVQLADIVSALASELAARDRAIELMATLITEQRLAIDAVNRQLDRMFAPERPRSGYIALRKAAAMIKKSDEYLRVRAARGEIDAQIIGDKWFVRIGALALPNQKGEG